MATIFLESFAELSSRTTSLLCQLYFLFSSDDPLQLSPLQPRGFSANSCLLLGDRLAFQFVSSSARDYQDFFPFIFFDFSHLSVYLHSFCFFDVVLISFGHALVDFSLMTLSLLYRYCFDFAQTTVLNHISFDFVSSFSLRDYLNSIYSFSSFLLCRDHLHLFQTIDYDCLFVVDFVSPLSAFLALRDHIDVLLRIIVNCLCFDLTLPLQHIVSTRFLRSILAIFSSSRPSRFSSDNRCQSSLYTSFLFVLCDIVSTRLRSFSCFSFCHLLSSSNRFQLSLCRRLPFLLELVLAHRDHLDAFLTVIVDCLSFNLTLFFFFFAKLPQYFPFYHSLASPLTSSLLHRDHFDALQTIVFRFLFFDFVSSSSRSSRLFSSFHFVSSLLFQCHLHLVIRSFIGESLFDAFVPSLSTPLLISSNDEFQIYLLRLRLFMVETFRFSTDNQFQLSLR